MDQRCAQYVDVSHQHSMSNLSSLSPAENQLMQLLLSMTKYKELDPPFPTAQHRQPLATKSTYPQVGRHPQVLTRPVPHSSSFYHLCSLSSFVSSLLAVFSGGKVSVANSNTGMWKHGYDVGPPLLKMTGRPYSKKKCG